MRLEADAVADVGQRLGRRVGKVKDFGQDFCAVAVGPCREDISAAGQHRDSQLDGEICQIGDTHHTERLRDHADVVKIGPVDLGLRVFQVASNIPAVLPGDENVAVNDRRVGVVVGVSGEGGECVEPADIVADKAAPEFALGKTHMSKAVTTPKLLEPLRRVWVRSVLEVELALTISPEARTIWRGG